MRHRDGIASPPGNGVRVAVGSVDDRAVWAGVHAIRGPHVLGYERYGDGAIDRVQRPPRPFRTIDRADIDAPVAPANGIVERHIRRTGDVNERFDRSRRHVDLTYASDEHRQPSVALPGNYRRNLLRGVDALDGAAHRIDGVDLPAPDIDDTESSRTLVPHRTLPQIATEVTNGKH